MPIEGQPVNNDMGSLGQKEAVPAGKGSLIDRVANLLGGMANAVDNATGGTIAAARKEVGVHPDNPATISGTSETVDPRVAAVLQKIAAASPTPTKEEPASDSSST